MLNVVTADAIKILCESKQGVIGALIRMLHDADRYEPVTLKFLDEACKNNGPHDKPRHSSRKKSAYRRRLDKT